MASGSFANDIYKRKRIASTIRQHALDTQIIQGEIIKSLIFLL